MYPLSQNAHAFIVRCPDKNIHTHLKHLQASKLVPACWFNIFAVLKKTTFCQLKNAVTGHTQTCKVAQTQRLYFS